MNQHALLGEKLELAHRQLKTNLDLMIGRQLPIADITATAKALGKLSALITMWRPSVYYASGFALVAGEILDQVQAETSRLFIKLQDDQAASSRAPSEEGSS